MTHFLKRNLSQNDGVRAVFNRIHFTAYFTMQLGSQIDLTEGGVLYSRGQEHGAGSTKDRHLLIQLCCSWSHSGYQVTTA